MRNISERDAKSRLASKWVAGALSTAGAYTMSAPSSNQDLLKGIKPSSKTSITTAKRHHKTVPSNSVSTPSRNQAILGNLPVSKAIKQRKVPQTPTPLTNKQSNDNGIGWIGWVITIIVAIGLLRACAG
jgi:hypothetical protein